MICGHIQSLDTIGVTEYEVLGGRTSIKTRAAYLLALECAMDIDEEKVEQTVLALLYLNTINGKFAKRAWKGFPWAVMDMLHAKGYISDPATKNKSVVLSEEGATLSKELFEKLFAR